MWLHDPLFKSWTRGVSRCVFGCSLGSGCARQRPFGDYDPSVWMACLISWVPILPRIGVHVSLFWEDVPPVCPKWGRQQPQPVWGSGQAGGSDRPICSGSLAVSLTSVCLAGDSSSGRRS